MKGLAFTALAIVGVFAAGCGGAAGGGAAGASSPVGAGGMVTDFAIRDTNGATFRLSDHLGKEVILLDFWATWCEPCMAEMPHLEDLYEKDKGRGFLVVGISMDGPETVADVPSFAKRHGMTFPVGLDEDSHVVSIYNPKRAAPLSVLIDRQGKIVRIRESYNAGDEELVAADVTQALGPVAK